MFIFGFDGDDRSVFDDTVKVNISVQHTMPVLFHADAYPVTII
jgi:hypothetical protein